MRYCCSLLKPISSFPCTWIKSIASPWPPELSSWLWHQTHVDFSLSHWPILVTVAVLPFHESPKYSVLTTSSSWNGLCPAFLVTESLTFRSQLVTSSEGHIWPLHSHSSFHSTLFVSLALNLWSIIISLCDYLGVCHPWGRVSFPSWPPFYSQCLAWYPAQNRLVLDGNDWLLSRDPIVSHLSPALTNLPQLSFPAVLSLVAPPVPCASESFSISHLRCRGEDILQSERKLTRKELPLYSP